MKTSSTRQFGVAAAVVSLVVLAACHNLLAQSTSESDELKILTAAGGPIADIFIPEPAGAGTEPSALFAPTTALGPLQPPGSLPGFFPPGLPGVSYVILTEPPTEPVDPTELPPVFYGSPTGGQVPVSDLLINGMNNQAGAPPFIALVSDNNPDLAQYVATLPPGVPVLAETGALQDLTALMGPSVFPGIGQVDVQVQSDVTSVPEPSTVVLVGLGAVSMLIARRRLSVRSRTRHTTD